MMPKHEHIFNIWLFHSIQ